MPDFRSVNMIEVAIAVGFTPSEAIQNALGVSLAHFAADAGCTATQVSMCLNGYPGRVYSGIRDALCRRLGVPRDRLDRWISDYTTTVAAS